MNYKVLDLFCGGGGGAMGVRNSLLKWGIEPEFVGVEHDPKIAYVYSQNVGKVVIRDLRKLKAIPRVKMVIATPPCQQWSLARTKTTSREDGEIGLLLPRVLARAKPRYFILENVEGYKNSQSFGYILNSLTELGYHWNYTIACCGGFIPQSRKRLFLWASKSKLRPGNPFHSSTLPRKSGLPLGQVGFPQKYPLESNSQKQSWGGCKQFRKELRKCPSSKVVPRQRKAIQDWLVLKEYEGLKHSNNLGTELLIERGAMRSDRKPTIRSAKQPCFTLTVSKCKTPTNINYVQTYGLNDSRKWQVKTLSIKALAALQGWEKNYQWTGEFSIDGSIIGGAVPPPAFEAITEFLCSC